LTVNERQRRREKQLRRRRRSASKNRPKMRRRPREKQKRPPRKQLPETWKKSDKRNSANDGTSNVRSAKLRRRLPRKNACEKRPRSIENSKNSVRDKPKPSANNAKPKNESD
jgi:hypothetical protein